MPQVRAYACDDARSQYHPMMIDIREPGVGEVLFDIKYAGICHSDIHTARSEWGPIPYPFVGGHEIAGVVTKIGEGVTKFKVGDRIGVGAQVRERKLPLLVPPLSTQLQKKAPSSLWPRLLTSLSAR